ncbi:MAG: nuclear transport factor 2 family protein [Myxococcota bacterium]
MATPEQMREIVRRQVRLWKTATHPEWRACFTPDYRIEDPVGTGFRPMGSYEAEWNNMHASALRLDMEIYRLTVGGHEVVADLRAVTHLDAPGRGPDAQDGARSTLSYTGIYTVNDAGLLATNRTFADPVNETLWAAFYPTLPPPSSRPPLPRSEAELKQAVEDHLYFWNTGDLPRWRRRFREDALVEDPIGRGSQALGTGRELFEPAHARDRRVLLGAHRVIVCGLEVLAHTVHCEERTGSPPRTTPHTELFRFDAEGRIESWRVFREDG